MLNSGSVLCWNRFDISVEGSSLFFSLSPSRKTSLSNAIYGNQVGLVMMSYHHPQLMGPRICMKIFCIGDVH